MVMELRTMADVGVRARELRRLRGWTQSDLADRLGVSRAWVVRLEQGAPRLEANRVFDAMVLLGAPLESPEPRTIPDEDDPFAAVFEGLTT